MTGKHGKYFSIRNNQRYPVARHAAAVLLVIMAATLAACGGGSGYSSAASSSSSTSSSSSSASSGASLSVAFASLPAFTAPVLALQAPADNTHWYVAEQAGYLRSFSIANSASVSTFLDITNRVTAGGEMGLLGFAFHPNFPTDPRVFVAYTATVNGVPTSRISAFTTLNNGTTVDTSSEVILLTVTQPEANHKGGNIVFGPDGYLYIGFGDGGGAGDMHGANGNGQNLDTLLGKVLRIDVGTAIDTDYTIPFDNPYIGSPSANPKCGAGGSGSQPCPEIYAFGFRNPWRFSFDAQNGDLWVADVGQGAWEEIDVVVKGGNYGWRCYEGTHAFNTANCNATNYLDPVWQYDHSQGDIAVTGGYVYRGNLFGAMLGKYIYGDYGSGRIWALTPPSGAQAALLIDSDYNISSFAEGNDGELYVLDYTGGKFYKLSF